MPDLTKFVALSPEHRRGNIESAFSRNLPWFRTQRAHEGRWNIIAGGPSLQKEVQRIKTVKGEIVAMNGSYDYLVNKGILPDYFIMVDPREHNVRFVQRPSKGTVYLIAAHCDPGVFDSLEGQDVRVWLPADYKLEHNGRRPVAVGGGSTVGLRAINLGWALGYRDFHLYGFDGCINRVHHAYPQPENDGEFAQPLTFYGKEFLMTQWMVNQVSDFEELLEKNPELNIRVHTNGVIQWVLKHSLLSV